MLNGAELPLKDLSCIHLLLLLFTEEELVYVEGYGALDSRIFLAIISTACVQSY